MSLFIVGSHRYTDFKSFEFKVSRFLNVLKIQHKLKIDTIEIGNSLGTDLLAQRFALKHKLNIKVHHTDWLLGKKAILIRNINILENSIALIAFLSSDASNVKNIIELSKNSIIIRHVVRI
jgi:hypothetical protein